MGALEQVRAGFPEPARDLKVNLQAVFQGGALNVAQRWGVAVATAVASRNAHLRDAVIADARREVDAAVIDDALAAATLMGMNNVYYRFRHMIGKASYAQKPARLRMNRLAKPSTDKTDFELFCLAVSAVNGCEMCVRSHEQVVLEGGLSEDHVHDAVRIAAVIHGAAVATDLADAAAVGGEAVSVQPASS